VKVEVVGDVSDGIFQGFELSIGAVKTRDVHVDGWSGNSPFAGGGQPIGAETVYHILDFVVVDNDFVTGTVGGASSHEDSADGGSNLG
jgi:hypothetical protein